MSRYSIIAYDLVTWQSFITADSAEEAIEKWQKGDIDEERVLDRYGFDVPNEPILENE